MSDLGSDEKVVAFFHPHCDSGGGGERVLWVMIDALLRHEDLRSRHRIFIYCATTAPKTTILKHVQQTFGIDLTATEVVDKIHFVSIRSSSLLDARWYPVATMVGQSLGSVLVGLECLLRLAPDVYVDTTGAAFTYPLAYFLIPPCQIVAYVHYPIISSDMLQRVREQRPSYNNNAAISGSTTVSFIKLIYYKVFAWLYGLAGSCASVVYVNSSWTEGHVAHMWGLKLDTAGPVAEQESGSGSGSGSGGAPLLGPAARAAVDRISAEVKRVLGEGEGGDVTIDDGELPEEVLEALQLQQKSAAGEAEAAAAAAAGAVTARKLFPPCNTSALVRIDIDAPRDGRSPEASVRRENTRFVVSVGQFRPEKDHSLQLRAFALYIRSGQCERDRRQHLSGAEVVLVLLGSTRNQADEQLVHALQEEARGLGIADRVRFVLNTPYALLHAWLAAASVGLHTMWNEHFGISVVEMMAAGLVVVAHNSGGPRLDIVCPPRPAAAAAATATAAADKTHTGYLASTEEEYAECISLALRDGEEQEEERTGVGVGVGVGVGSVRRRARLSVQRRFSDEAFSRRVRQEFRDIIL